jgi:protein PhnA
MGFRSAPIAPRSIFLSVYQTVAEILGFWVGAHFTILNARMIGAPPVPMIVGRLKRLRHPQRQRPLMSIIPVCPQCTLENTYPDGENYLCADCGYEWPMAQPIKAGEDAAAVVKDSNGNILADGDAVVLIKDLKVKGSSLTLKVGTKVKSIRLASGDHEVDCKMEAGNFMLKARYLRKV